MDQAQARLKRLRKNSGFGRNRRERPSGAKETAEELGISGEAGEMHPSVAKAALVLQHLWHDLSRALSKQCDFPQAVKPDLPFVRLAAVRAEEAAEKGGASDEFPEKHPAGQAQQKKMPWGSAGSHPSDKNKNVRWMGHSFMRGGSAAPVED